MDKDILLKIELPKGWAKATISEMISADGVFVDGDWIESKDQDQNGDVRLIQLADIGDGDFRDKSSRFLTLKRAKEIGCTFLLEGDILVARMPDPIGRACLFPLKGENKFVTAVDVAIIRTGKASINNKLLNYFINSPIIRNKIEALQSGTTRKRISRGNLSLIEFPVPPLNEQNRIVDKLDELLSELEKGKEQLQTSLEQLKVYRQSILKHAFEGKFPRKKLGNILSYIGSGITPKGGKSVYQNAGVIFIRSQNVYPNKLLLDEVAYISDKIDERMKRTRVQPFDVLLNITGASIGRCTYVPEGFPRANVNQHVCILRADQDILNCAHLSYYFNSPEGQDLIMNSQSGATRQGLNFQQIRNFEIPFPDLKTQLNIVQHLEEKLSLCDNTETTIRDEINKAFGLRQSLLQKAFEGKLVEQNPNDEPARVLLERIKKEREEFLKTEKEKKKNEKRPMKKKSAAKVFDFPLIDTIKGKFEKKSFTFDQLKSEVDINYDDLREELFSLLDDEKVLTMEFDQQKESMTFKYTGK